MVLRGDDPEGMKDFILKVQNRAATVPTGGGGREEEEEEEEEREDKKEKEKAGLPQNKRVRFMLDTIIDIKNNRKRVSELAPYVRLKKWLQKLRVEDVQLRVVTWQQLLQHDKKGQWWLPAPAGAGTSQLRHADVAGAIDADVAEADKMLQLAAAQRMNTDARRAIFCVVMSGEDYVDAFEKILRLKLPGKQDREVLRVVVECCLQEAAFNPYYALLAARLCSHDRNHKFTLQFLLWDQYKELHNMELRRSSNLARLQAHIFGCSALSVSCLKVVDFADITVMSAKAIIHFRILFESLLLDNSREKVWTVLSRLAALPGLAALREGLALFLERHVRVHSVTVAEAEGGKRGALLVKRCQLAKKALNNVAGITLKR